MQRPIALSDGYVDIERAQVVRSKTIALTGQEVRLLDHLARHPGRTFTVEELLRDVWGYHHKVASRTVSTTVHRIRRKIEVDPKDPKHLVNTFGVGYRLELAHHSIVVAPVSLGPFVGRESMMEAFDQAIGQAHLVTIVGPPGAGKTRLAMEACRHRHAVFCSLADVSTGVGLENEVSVALGALALKAWPGESAIGASLRRLGEVILVLDNFEGAVEHAPVLMSWLHQAPRARIVVTSRERTRLAGELVLDLGGLAPQDASTLFAMLVGDAAVAEQAATAEVVDALDGLPLAIELAASHARVLGVGGVREQTRTNPLDLPAARGGPSLRGALERSWVLLSEAEQATLSRCALFSAPFDLDAVKAVVETETPIHEVMASLRDRSLFRTDIAPPRFGLYASVRAFADEKLSDLDRARAEERHARHYLEIGDDGTDNLMRVHRRFAARDPVLAVRAILALRDRMQRQWTLQKQDYIFHQVENGLSQLPLELRVALLLVRCAQLRRAGRRSEGWTVLDDLVGEVDRLPPGLGSEVLVEQGRYLHDDHAMEPSFAAGKRALALAPADTAEAGQAYLVCGQARQALHDLEGAVDAYRKARAIFSSLELTAELGLALGRLGLAVHACGRDDDAVDQLVEAERVLAEVGDHHWRARVLGYLGNIHLMCGDPDQALARYKDSLDLHYRMGSLPWAALTEMNIGLSLLELGRLEEAYRHATTATDLYTRVEDPRFTGLNYLNLASIQLHRGRVEAAREAAWSAIEIARGLDHAADEQMGHAQLACVSIETGAFDEAESHMGVALGLGTEGNPERSAELYCWRGVLRALSGDLSGALEPFAEAKALFERAPSRCLRDLLPICERLVAWKRGEVPTGVFRDELTQAGSSTIAEVRLAARWFQRELSGPTASP